MSKDARVFRASARGGDGARGFLGVLVDSSASMRLEGGHAEAIRLASALAQAVEGLPGVETRLAGYRDDVLLDAGSAGESHLSAVVAGGGNNDAAALDWMGACALRVGSGCRVVVWLSDGSPSACSWSALEGCAQRWAGSGVRLVHVLVGGGEPLPGVPFLRVSPGGGRASAVRLAELMQAVAMGKHDFGNGRSVDAQ
ncbi:MAG: hypothetical protein EA398_10940 [Deltaproteobacteria bacterium]|nr:MAG: hypothetical protein EA398_10940 [Deltaproteobacteria bacterium]